MLRLTTIQENHQNSLDTINSFRNSECAEMKAITEFLLQTDVNPYSFLPSNFAGGFNTSSGFENLLHMIHHALVDDGDISFPVVNGSPRISFVYKWEDNYADYVLSDAEKLMRDQYGTEYEVDQCTDVFHFIEKFELCHTKEVRRWFITDAARFGIEWAADKYENFARYDWSWETDPEVLAEIEAFRDTMIKSGRMKGV